MQCVYAFVCGYVDECVDGYGNGFENDIARFKKSNLIIEL